MNFISWEFIVFCLVTFIVYYIVGFIKAKHDKFPICQWHILLISSLLFYGLYNYLYLVYLFASAFISYFAALLCQKDGFKHKKLVTTLAIIFNLSILAVLKYYNFFAGSINSLFKCTLPIYKFIVPLGISFYTFSLISYNVDCYKNECKSEKNIFKFILYISYFPKIIQGPIVTYDEMCKDGLFETHRFLDNNYINSLSRISIGLIKKLAIANVLNIYVNGIYSNVSSSSSIMLIIGTLLYSIQLYCDFSGFMDISIGISNMLGIKLIENFDTPYASTSIQEFWRRWHITLGAWLRKYIYLPLGGNRVSVCRWCINILIVWLVSGIWHGANWTYVIWGLYHGILLVLFGLSKQIKKSKGIALNSTTKEPQNSKTKYIKMLFTFILVNFGWVFFRSSSLEEAYQYFKGIVKVWNRGTYNVFLDHSISEFNWVFIISLLLVIVLVVYKVIEKNIAKSKIGIYKIMPYVKYISMILFFSFSIFMFFYLESMGGGQSSFIYFDF